MNLALLPRPQHLWIDDPAHFVSTAGLLDEISVGTCPQSEQWTALAEERPETLGTEGYVLKVQDASPRILVAAADDAGRFRARERVRRLVESGPDVPVLTMRDAPHLARRGVVEGFYGDPWSHRERLDFFRFAGRVALNEYIYAPKDDPLHRERWRERYPADGLADIAELANEAAGQHVRFVYAISPALDMQFASDADHDALAAKAEQLWDAGVRSFALLFDDVALELPTSADRARFGVGPDGAGRAHGVACARFAEYLRARHDLCEPVTMCPTDYAGSAPSAYRRGLDETLPHDAIVMWTGSDIVVGEVTTADIVEAAESFNRRLLLWDNFPVNDFYRSRLFLGPLLGRTTETDGTGLVGIASNPMVEAVPSRFALATVADWGWNPVGYEPDDASQRAIDVVAGRDAESIRALVAVCSSWPPSASQSAAIESLAAAALAGERDALDTLASQFERLSRTASAEPIGYRADHLLLSALEPWSAAARDAGTAGKAACALLEMLRTVPGADPEVVDAAVREVTTTAKRAEGHHPNVLRSILQNFVRAVLARAGIVDVHSDKPLRIAIIAGRNPVPGDRDLAERLSARGHHVDVEREGGATPYADLLVVTAAASVDAARLAAVAEVPLLAWGRLDTLRLATGCGVLIGQEEIRISSARHPLAAGFEGTVTVYRGPASLTWSENAGLGEVVARSTREDRAVIVRFAEGTPLPGGGGAPADRVAFFLGKDGLAPWLMTEAGRALFDAAVGALTDGKGSGPGATSPGSA